MNRQEFYRRAANDEGQIVSYRYGANPAKAVVQIVHNASEYAGRYQETAERLQGAGFTVIMNDITGHGMSKQGHRGAFALSDDSLDPVIRDIHSLFAFERKRYPEEEGLPRVLIGIGAGGLLSEYYAGTYHDIDLMILIGSLEQPAGAGAVVMTAANHILRHGHGSVSPAVHNMLKPARVTGSDETNRYYWLTRDQEEIVRYMNDPDCGFPLSASSYKELLRAFRETRNKDGARKIADIPIYILSGSEDQLGECGKAPWSICNLLGQTGHSQVAMKLFTGAFHDLLHETCKDEVIQDILLWIHAHIEA